MFTRSPSGLTCGVRVKGKAADLADEETYQSDSPASGNSLSRSAKRPQGGHHRRQVALPPNVSRQEGFVGSTPPALGATPPLFPPPNQGVPDFEDRPIQYGGAGETIYLDYELVKPPPADPDYTRFVFISDTHGGTFTVPEGDVLFHTGDLSNEGTLSSLTTTFEWLIRQPHKYKIIIAGNHDITMHPDYYKEHWQRFPHHRQYPEIPEEAIALFRSPRARAAGLVYLDEEACTFRVTPEDRLWTVYGSPWTPYFGGYAFNYRRGEEAKEHARLIPPCDILLTHGPPSGVLDIPIYGQSAGCVDLADRLLMIKPQIHAFGHIHESHGVRIIDWEAGGPETAPPPYCQTPPPNVYRAFAGDVMPDRPSSRAAARNPPYDSPPPGFNAENYRDKRSRTSSMFSASTRSSISSFSSTSSKSTISSVSSIFSRSSRSSTSTMTSIASGNSVERTSYMWPSEPLRESPEPPNPYDIKNETICVNSACLPIGNKARDKRGNPVGIAGKGFRPVIIDIPKENRRSAGMKGVEKSMAKLKVYDR